MFLMMTRTPAADEKDSDKYKNGYQIKARHVHRAFDPLRRELTVARMLPQKWFVGWLLNVPATCLCISGTDLHRQFYVLPH